MSNTTLTPRPVVLAEVRVGKVERLSPAFVRVHLCGDELAELGVQGHWLDQRIKLIFPTVTGRLPDVEADESWYARWLAIPEGDRGWMRTYTVRDVYGDGVDTCLVVDVVVHDPSEHTGPGNDWARNAAVGDQVVVVAPRRGHQFGGREFAPPRKAPLLLIADETAVPAIAGILRDIAPEAVGMAFLEVPATEDLLDLDIPPHMEVIWLPRNGRPRGECLLTEVTGRLGLSPEPVIVADDDVDPNLWETSVALSPDRTILTNESAGPSPYVWMAGEAKVVTTLRRVLVREGGMDKQDVAFMGYWREGVAMRS